MQSELNTKLRKIAHHLERAHDPAAIIRHNEERVATLIRISRSKIPDLQKLMKLQEKIEEMADLTQPPLLSHKTLAKKIRDLIQN
jgi:hypothetical protein